MTNFKHTPTTYAEARSVFANARPRNGLVTLGNNTYLRRVVGADLSDPDGEPIYQVVFYDTPVVVFYADGGLALNSGGYVTLTTAVRMNAFTPDDIHVNRERGEFVVRVGKRPEVWDMPGERFVYGWAVDALA